MSKVVCFLLAVLILVVLGIIIWGTCTTSGVAFFESWRNDVKQTRDNTNYETRKQVEDTCRAMMAQYKTDVDMYELYKGSDDPEKQQWAEEAYIRACSTANKYNEFILKNSYVWKNDVPLDIKSNLPKPNHD